MAISNSFSQLGSTAIKDLSGESAEPISRSVLTFAWYGLLVWLVYGMVEFVVACGIPVLFEPEVEILGWQWRPITLLFGIYVLFGAIAGIAVGVLLAQIENSQLSGRRCPPQVVANLTLVLAFAANLISAWPLETSEYIALAIAVVLGVLFVMTLASTLWFDRLAFLANAWIVSWLLLTIPWVSHLAWTHHSIPRIAALSVSILSITLLAAVSWHRLRSKKMTDARRRTAVAGAAAMLLLSSIVLARRPGPVLASQATQSLVQTGKANVILITMDTVRADHLSLYGYERDTTPQLRDFAQRATVYTRAIATSDWTLPTHASIFTGLYPSWHGAYVAPPQFPWGRPLASRHATLAELLHANGYWTAAEVANYGFLSPSLGLARGFTVYNSPRPVHVVQMPWERRSFYLRERARRILSLAEDTPALDGNVLRADDINQRAFRLLDQAMHYGRPFFLFVNYMDAHGPYVLPAPFDTKFHGRDPHFSRVSGQIRLTLGVNSGQHKVREFELRHLVSQYDGAIAYEDAAIGRLLTRLQELGIYDNTLIIITSDHGDSFGEHNLMGHNVGSVYQDLVRVPLLVKYPGQSQPHQSDDLVSHVDLMPTILDVLKISQLPGVQGRSLHLSRADSVVYSEAIAVAYLAKVNPRLRGERRTILAGSAKLITWTDGPSELYDLAMDPEETRNLYQADDPRVKVLADRLSAWAAAAPPEIEQRHQLDKNGVEKLKSLGYAQ